MAHIDRQPSQRVFDDMKKAAGIVWVMNYDDTYGYVTEKLERVNQINNYADNWYTFVGMFDSNNQMKFAEQLEFQESLDFLREQRAHYGYALPRVKK